LEEISTIQDSYTELLVVRYWPEEARNLNQAEEKRKNYDERCELSPVRRRGKGLHDKQTNH
jgi:hypothetical protein